MSDLLQLGANGIRLYQSALKTVSNNIANASTPGYSRQTTVINEATPVPLDRFFVGTGALVERIERAYDAAVESSLRDSSSDLNAQGPMISYTNRVLDIMGSQAVGLTDALDKFFSAAENLSVDPASSTLRTLFLNEAEGVAARFNELSGQVLRAADDSQALIEQDVNDLNALGAQLVRINQQLGRRISEDAQPPALLDERDKLLRDMAALAKVNININDAGQATVKLGGSSDNNLFVTAARSYDLTATFSDTNAGNIVFTLDATGDNRVIAGPSGGTIAGAVTFRSQVLQPAITQLDNLAQSFSDAVNGVQEQGLDANGNAGQALFVIDPAAANQAQAITTAFSNPNLIAAAERATVNSNGGNISNASGSLTYNTQDSTALYDIVFTSGSTYSIVDPAGNSVSENNAYVANQAITFGNVSTTILGAVQPGDRFSIRLNDNGAQNGIVFETDAGNLTYSQTNAGGIVTSGPFVIDPADPITAGTVTASFAGAPQAGSQFLMSANNSSYEVGVEFTANAKYRIRSPQGVIFVNSADYLPGTDITHNNNTFDVPEVLPNAGDSFSVPYPPGTQAYTIRFTDPNTYSIVDTNGAVILADQVFDPANQDITYQNITTTIALPVQAGDEVRVDFPPGTIEYVIDFTQNPEYSVYDPAGNLLASNQQYNPNVGAVNYAGLTLSLPNGPQVGNRVPVTSAVANQTYTVRFNTSTSYNVLINGQTISASNVYDPNNGSINFNGGFLSFATPPANGESFSFNSVTNDLDFTIRFDTENSYSLFDASGTLISSNNAYDPAVGIKIGQQTVTFSEQPAANDSFTIESNINGTGDNTNLMDLINLRNTATVNGTDTFSDAYFNIVNSIGTKARFSEITRDALQVVHDQAVDTKDEISGVNLDQEAADLIRFQQAYQASAQVIQTANRIFDSILNAS